MEILKFFWTIFYINLFTIGGGYVMLPLLQREVVDHYHWLSNKEFIDSIAIGQVTPGPLTIMNVFIGYKIFGLWGALGAVIFSYLPSIIVVTIASHYYLKFKNSWIVKASFKGIRPCRDRPSCRCCDNPGKGVHSRCPHRPHSCGQFCYACVYESRTDVHNTRRRCGGRVDLLT